MTSSALLPSLTKEFKHQWVANVLAVIFGVLLISLLAQVSLPLPFTPVPITGQTFAVTLVALLWGQKRGFAVLISYLSIGALGMPVFAQAQAGLSFGPTFGYLIGMMSASLVVGYFSDRGVTKSFGKSLLVAYLGSAIVFGFGIIGLSFFLPKEALLAAGVIPFLPGDTIKNILAVSLVRALNQKLNR